MVVASDIADLPGVFSGELVVNSQSQSREADGDLAVATKRRIGTEPLDHFAQPDCRPASLGDVDGGGVEGMQTDVQTLEHLVGSLFDGCPDVLTSDIGRGDLTGQT